jgi:hypothetical protein
MIIATGAEIQVSGSHQNHPSSITKIQNHQIRYDSERVEKLS